MTPSELLNEAVIENSNPVLYYDDPDDLHSLLKKALGVFQQKAGFIMQTVSPEVDGTYQTTFAVPDGFLSLATCEDRNGTWHHVTESAGELTIEVKCMSSPPFLIYYFFNFRGMDCAVTLDTWAADTEYEKGRNAIVNSAGDSFFCVYSHSSVDGAEPAADSYDDTLWKPYNHIPDSCIDPILQYLSALIRQKNMARARRVMKNAAIEDELPDDAALTENIRNLEEAMTDMQCLIPVTMIRQ